MVNKEMTVLFLCQQPADYLFSCIISFCQKNGYIGVCIYKNPKSENPYTLHAYKQHLDIIEYNDTDVTVLKNIITQRQPKVIYFAGWRDAKYLPATIFARKKNIPVIWGIDTPWQGTLKQWIGLLPLAICKMLSGNHAFVSGNAQYAYARRLGFAHEAITEGLYTANNELYNIPHRESVPHRFVFVGRLIPYKWVLELYREFLAFNDEERKDWHLVIIGNGELEQQLKDVSGLVKVIPFMQPAELAEVLREGGVGCVPSISENWGLVVHEFAMSGMPLITSDRVYSSSRFLVNEYNGYTFKAGSKDSLKRAMLRIINTREEDLVVMANASRKLSERNSIEMWCSSFKSFLNV